MSNVMVGTALPSMLPPGAQVKMARFLELLGYQQIWLPDHVLFPEGSPAYDCWTTMAHLAGSTKSVQFGTAVTDPHRTHPVVLAQRIATLDKLSRGRFILGLGSGEAMNLEPYGIPWRERKVGKLKEFITVLRAMLDSRDRFDFEGDFYQLKNARLGCSPYKDRRVPIFMAALGPMMQKLAGRMADGWFPTLIPAREYANYFQPMADSARAAGRDPSTLSKVATLAVCIDTDGKADLDQVIENLRPLSGLLVWPPVMKRLGHSFDPPEGSYMSYMEVNPCDPESIRAYSRMMSWMPTPMMKEAVTFGNCDDVYEECRRYVDQGATHLMIQFPSLDPLGNFIFFAHQVLPRLTGRPATPLARALGSVGGPLIRMGLARKYFPAPRTPSTEFLALRWEDENSETAT